MSSVFSRTITKSRSSRRLRAPLYALTGRTRAKRSSSWRSATFTLRNPLPIGVVIGPLRATLFLRIEASTCSGSGVPNSAIDASPACWTSQSNSTPVASMTRTVASQISGPTPSPGMRVTGWRNLGELPVFEIVGVDLDEIAPLLRNLVLGKDRVDRTRVDARAAVDALVRVDVIHRCSVVGVDAVDRTHLHA